MVFRRYFCFEDIEDDEIISSSFGENARSSFSVSPVVQEEDYSFKLP